jgi:capsular exopolysaccharide synthesis family protein
MELVKLYTALLRRRWLVAQSVVFFTLLGLILALVLPKNYTATTKVLINSSDTTLSILSELGLSEVATGLASESDDISNKIALSSTRPVLDEVIWKLQLRDSDGKLLTTEQLLVAGLTGELEARANIAITQSQGTDILLFEARANDPELARLLADAVVQMAIQRAQERAKADTRNARLFIEQQLDLVREEFDRAMAEMAQAKADEQILDLDAELKAAIARLSELMLAYEQNAASVQEMRARLYEARAYQGRESVAAISPATVNLNDRIRSLRERLVDLRQQRATELTDKTESHPDIARLDALIRAAEGELQGALEEQHNLDPTVAQLEAQLAGLEQKGQEISASIQRTTAEFSAWPDKVRRMSQLQLAASAAEAVYQSLQEKRYEIGVAEAMLVSDLQLIEPSIQPDKHSSPKVLVNTILGFIVGCAFGLGLAFVMEYIDDSVKTAEDLHEVWPAPRLGLIPRFDGGGERRVIEALPRVHPVVEAYRSVRSALRFTSLDRELRVIAVTSAMPGEGKSTFSTNLAISYAHEGRRVLLVDCDLRRPTQHRAFATVSNDRGLTDVLTRRLDLAAAVQESPLPNLALLCSGPVPPDPGRLVESQRLVELLAELRQGWDLVVVDTPPALVVNDALLLCKATDGLVVVVESGETTRRLLVDLQGRLGAASVELLGLVLNKVDLLTTGYGRYARAYAKYAEGAKGSAREPTPPAPPAPGGGA